MSAPKSSNYTSVATAAERLGVSGNTIRKLVLSGKLNALRLPSGRIKIEAADIDRVFAELRSAATVGKGLRYL